jgi:negative regulator of sigma E activity
MRRGAALLSLGLLLALVPRAPSAAPGAGDIIRRAFRSSRHVAYEGVRSTTLWLEKGAEAFEAREFADGKGRTRVEYLAPPAMKGRIVIDDGKHRFQIEPGGKKALRSASSPQEEAGWNLALLLRNYRVVLDPRRDTVARRSAYCVELAPHHSGKPKVKLWIDTGTFLVLKRDARHADGSPARASTFSEVSYNAPPAERNFHFKAGPGVVVSATAAARSEQDGARAHGWIGAPHRFPARLRASGYELRRTLGREEAGQRSLHLLYEDGLSTLSVFVDRAASQAVFQGGRPVRIGSRSGSVKTSGHFGLLRWQAHGLRYTAVGDLTEQALVAVARDLTSG